MLLYIQDIFTIVFESQTTQYILRNLQLVQFILLSLQLTHQVQHPPRMSRLYVDPLEHFGQQQVSGLLVVRLENYGRYEIQEVASYGIRVADQVQGEFYHFLLQFSLKGNYDVLC